MVICHDAGRGTTVSELRFFNTLARSKQMFESLEPGRVRMYSCGPTVYSRQHIGNMRPYVFADLLKRTLRLFGYRVTHVINVTDVGHLTSDADSGEDKMELASQRSGESVWDIAARYTQLWQQDLDKIGVEKPDQLCRATDHIPEQIAMIQQLETRGFTYRISDGVYYDTARFPSYTELSGADFAAQQAQERIEHAGEKRSAADFALWKLSPAGGPPRQMEWDSPWGRGFPGWHIECSAMGARYLGVPFDIHTGGIDHVPVHHTNEIAQTEAATGKRPCVRFWMHNGWVMIDGSKISKSSGATVNLDHLDERGIHPRAFRYFLLSAHYRQQLNFTAEAIDGAQSAYERLARHAETLREKSDAAHSERAAPYRERFRAAMGDDLNTPQALAVVWEMLRSGDVAEADRWRLLCEFDDVLGLGLREVQVTGRHSGDSELDARIDALVAERDDARNSRNFARADEIRKQLQHEGIVLEDSPQGTRWRRG
jgi:cysteinyl-tRNA synthetase